MPKILFVHNCLARFVQLDLECLGSSYQVTECYLPSKRINPATITRQVASHDLVVGWFASWHTFLPFLLARWMGKQSLLVVCGYDVANVPSIGYGHQRGGTKKWVSRGTMRLANCLITTSYHSQEEAGRSAGIRKERVHVVYLGVPDLFGSLPQGPRARIALTVGNVDRSNLWRKGHEPFVRAAALLPDVEFVLAGAWKDDAIEYLRALATPNVSFPGRVDEPTLLDYYRRSPVYIQASAHEGFGLSVAEAMLAGCVPVVTRAGALPEVVGDAGVYAESQDPVAVAGAIRQAFDLPNDARMRARQRILESFPMARRQRSLERLIGGLMRDSHSLSPTKRAKTNHAQRT